MPTLRHVCFIILASGGILCAIAGFTIAIIIFQSTNTVRQHDYLPLICGLGFAGAGILACVIGMVIFCNSRRRRKSVHFQPHPQISYILPEHRKFPTQTTV